MSPAHRPSGEALAAFAAGRLDEGLALVVAVHLESDPESRSRVEALRSVQGALLDASEPIAMSAEAEDVLSRATIWTPRQAAPRRTPERGLPRVLSPYDLGPWRRIGFGVSMRRVALPDAQARVFLLKARPGVALPHHRHGGLEWTAIIAGAYEHQHGRYAAGDFDEADADHEHTPRVDPVEGCTCIAAVTGGILFQSWLGRLVQPLVRL